jgi:predicted nucleotidyltransferase
LAAPSFRAASLGVVLCRAGQQPAALCRRIGRLDLNVLRAGNSDSTSCFVTNLDHRDPAIVLRLKWYVLAALDPLRKKINVVFVYGSVARSGETERSDVDLMVVGKVDFSVVVETLADAQKILNREINPTVYSVRDFRSKARGNFLKTVLADKKLFIIGDENVLRELVQK